MRAAAEVAEPPAATASTSLKSLEVCDVVNEFGFVFPEVPDDTEASAFLVYDSQKKPMYLGFSKDLRNTLRTLLVRRPELCYHYKCVNLVKAIIYVYIYIYIYIHMLAASRCVHPIVPVAKASAQLEASGLIPQGGSTPPKCPTGQLYKNLDCLRRGELPP